MQSLHVTALIPIENARAIVVYGNWFKNWVTNSDKGFFKTKNFFIKKSV